MTTLYIASLHEYDDNYAVGIYSSLEVAQTALGGGAWKQWDDARWARESVFNASGNYSSLVDVCANIEALGLDQPAVHHENVDR